MPNYKITIERVEEPTDDALPVTTTEIFRQVVPCIDLDAIFAAINPKPKRTRRSKVSSLAST